MLNNLTYRDSDHLTDESKKLTFLNFPDWQLTPIRPVGRRNNSSLLSEQAGYHSESGPLDVALEDKTGTNALDRVVTINRPDMEAQLKEATGIPGLTEQERQTWASEQKAKRAEDCRSSKTKQTRGGRDASQGSKQTKIRQPTHENTSESPGKLVFSADKLFGPFHQLQLPVNM